MYIQEQKSKIVTCNGVLAHKGQVNVHKLARNSLFGPVGHPGNQSFSRTSQFVILPSVYKIMSMYFHSIFPTPSMNTLPMYINMTVFILFMACANWLTLIPPH